MRTLDTSKQIEIAQSPWKMAGLAILSVIMTVSSLSLALHWLQGVSPSSPAVLAGYTGTLFFGLCTLVIAWRMFAVSGPVVTISPAGIRDTRLAAEMIPWTTIIRISTWSYRRQKFLVLKVYPEAEKKLSLARIARFGSVSGVFSDLGKNALLGDAQQ